MKNLLSKLTLIIALGSLSQIASAELVIINGNSWDYEVSGSVRDSSLVTNEVNLKTDLLLKDNKEAFLLAYIEHPVPVLPNIRLGSSSLGMSGSGSVTKTFTYNNVNFSGTYNVTSRLNLDHTEIGIYWSILDNVVGFDLGLNAKFFDGSVYISDGTNTANEVFDETVPMLYAGLQFELPYGLQIAGDMSYLSFDGSSFTDTLVRLRWTSDFLLGVEVGYRSFVIDFEDTSTNEYANIDISGPYAGLHIAF